MRHYEVNYDVIDSRRVVIDTSDSVEIEVAKDDFIRNFEQYDDLSRSVDGDVTFISIDEIDENGEVVHETL
jgi:hypothetical protein